MQKMKYIILHFAFLLFSLNLFAQCTGDEVELTMTVSTDQYGHEVYWQIVPFGNDCDQDVLHFGGNSGMVNCDNAGAQVATAGQGYANNSVNEEILCLSPGMYTIYALDDYGDGLGNYNIAIDGQSLYTFFPTRAINVYTMTIHEPMLYDLAIETTNIDGALSNTTYPINAMVRNLGSEVVTTLDFTYQLNNEPEVTTTITGLSIATGETVEITHSSNLDLSSSSGEHTVTLTVSAPNGEVDGFAQNDIIINDIQVPQIIPNLTNTYLTQSYSVVEIAGTAEGLNYPSDLDFNFSNSEPELWVLNKRESDAVGGSTVTINNPGEAGQLSLFLEDSNAWFFMGLPTGIAFGRNGNFATSQGFYDNQHMAVEPYLTNFSNGVPSGGPTLWTSDLSIYAQIPGLDGSHIDVDYHAPRCQGIAHEKDNVFWTIDGFNGDLLRVDFDVPYGVGGSYLGDNVIRRFADDELVKDEANQIVSHLIKDPNSNWLYFVDHGNGRVLRLDVTTGTATNETPWLDQVAIYSEYTIYSGYEREEIITGLTNPSGIEIIGNHLYVSEFGGSIKIFDINDLSAGSLGTIETGYTSLQGIKIGPSGELYGVDMLSSTLFKVSTAPTSTKDISYTKNNLFYPSPAQNLMYLSEGIEAEKVVIYDLNSVELMSIDLSNTNQWDVSKLSSGTYIAVVSNDGLNKAQRFVVVR